MHYSRFQRTGSYDSARPRGRTCDVEGCTAPHAARGYCAKHYTRWQTHGDPTTVSMVMHYGDEVGYVAAHARLRRLRGPASDHPCARCHGPAAHWAYDHTDPNEKVGTDHGQRVPFSVDPARYLPMCVPCHKAFDLEQVGV